MDTKVLTVVGNDPRIVLALFGESVESHAISELFTISHHLFEQAGVLANVAAIHTKGRYGRYRIATTRLLRPIQDGTATGFSLAYTPNSETDAISFGQLTAQTTKAGFIISGRPDLAPKTPDATSGLIVELAETYPIIYGYQYVVDAAYGPTFHAVGMFYSSMKRRDIPKLPLGEKRRTSNWFNRFDKALATGALRDVFPLNLLTVVHRHRLIDGVSLFDWIEQDTSRGRLERITPTLWAWHVPEDRCVELGDLFEAEGLLA